MNIISFKQNIKDNPYSVIEPSTAIKNLPEWYKKTPKNIDNIFLVKSGEPNFTYKKCVPFFDAMSSGYLIFLNCDIYVDQNSVLQNTIQWRSEDTIVSTHNSDQVKYMDILDIYNKQPFKWINDINIYTKSGYSCLFTHPINRFDLPFQTLSAIVDTDKYQAPINFPFFLINNFNGIIPAGTPIVQIFPFKREKWKMKMTKKISENELISKASFSCIQNSYRNFFWQKKNYG